MNKFLILILCTFYVLTINAQDYKLIKEIEIKAKSIEVDKFDFLYIIETYKVSKYSKEGDLLFTYENLENGEISKFDVSDPLKPIVYYKDFNTLSILDGKLSELNSVNLFDKNINQIELICSSNNMEFWIYDNIENRLKKLDKQFNLVNQSEFFFNLFDEFSFPKEFKINNNQLYVLDDYGISIFDLYGAFIKKISIKDIESFQIFDKEIVFIENQSLNSYDENTLLNKKMFLPKDNEKAIQVKLLKDKLIARLKNNIKIYSLN